MKIKRAPSRLEKKARHGFKGYPVATVASCGRDNARACKVAVGVVTKRGEEPEFLERWFSESTDVRFDARIGGEILGFFKKQGVRSVVLSDSLLGCPHEEGIEYPRGETCPECPFWANRDRWTGELLPEQ